jgi:hypothetical protein
MLNQITIPPVFTSKKSEKSPKSSKKTEIDPDRLKHFKAETTKILQKVEYIDLEN